MTARLFALAALSTTLLGLSACKDNGTVENQPAAGSAVEQTLTQSQESSASDGSGGQPSQ